MESALVQDGGSNGLFERSAGPADPGSRQRAVCAIAGRCFRGECLDRYQMGASLSYRGPRRSQASCGRQAVAAFCSRRLAEREGRAAARYYSERALHRAFEARREHQQKRRIAVSAAHGVQFQKKPSWPASRSVQTSLRPGCAGAKARPALIRKSWSLSMKRAVRPT